MGLRLETLMLEDVKGKFRDLLKIMPGIFPEVGTLIDDIYMDIGRRAFSMLHLIYHQLEDELMMRCIKPDKLEEYVLQKFRGLQAFGSMQHNSLGREESVFPALEGLDMLEGIMKRLDEYTVDHMERTSKNVVMFAEDINGKAYSGSTIVFSPREIAYLQVAALYHDIGKISMGLLPLRRNGDLTDEEWEIMKLHPIMGKGLLREYAPTLDQIVFDAALMHHVQPDGKGYPTGIAYEEVPLVVRMLAIVDAYEAMTAGRPHRERKFSHEEAIEEIKRCSGTQFDPELVKYFIELNPDKLVRAYAVK